METYGNIFRQFLISAFCITLFFSHAKAQPAQYKFSQLNVKEGLSNVFVTDILQDSRGFLWFATRDGLNKFDGVSIKVYKHIPGDTTSLSNNFILSLFEDSQQNLWIGFEQTGFAKYNREFDNFTNYKNIGSAQTGQISIGTIYCLLEDNQKNIWLASNFGLVKLNKSSNQPEWFVPETQNTSSIQGRDIRSLALDKHGDLWIGTLDSGLNILNLKTGKIINKKNSPTFFKGLTSNKIWTLKRSRNNTIWIGTYDQGLKYFDDSGLFKGFETAKGKELLSNQQINTIFEDAKGRLWVALHNNGVCLYNLNTDELEIFKQDDNNPNSICSNSVFAIVEDNANRVWLATYGNGVAYLDGNNFFEHFFKFRGNDRTLTHNFVNSFSELNPNEIWICTDGGGVNVFDRNSNRFLRSYNTGSKPRLANNYLTKKILKIPSGEILISTWGNGLQVYNPRNNSFLEIIHQPNNVYSLIDDKIMFSYLDKKERLWVCSFGEGINVSKNGYERFINLKSWKEGDLLLPSLKYVKIILEDSRNNIWFGGFDGLCRFDGIKYHYYTSNEGDTLSLINNDINHIFEDSRGDLWIATMGGLCLFNRKTESFKSFPSINDFYTNSIKAIIEDNSGYLWVSGNSGLIRFNTKNNHIKKYTVSDGLQDNQFIEGSCLKSASGELYFGGYNGFNVFRPETIVENEHIPPVLITEFKINSQLQRPGNPQSPLKQDISNTKKIKLKYTQNAIGFTFVALNFIAPSKNQYCYMLEGFDATWNCGVLQNTANYTNLPPGDYVFRVKASNNDGYWNEEGASVAIKILPPFYKTKLALLLYLLFFLFILLLYRRYVIEKERIRTTIKNEKYQAQQQHELDMYKLKFFTNISHEFKTPLTLIMSPLEKLMDEEEHEEKKNQLNLIHRNARKLYQLINQLMDFRKIENGKLLLNLSGGDFVAFLRELYSDFEEIAQQKMMNYAFFSNRETALVQFDKDKIEKIVNNLLSNAFKFTPNKGIINLFVLFTNTGEGSFDVKIKVKDTGIGLSDSDKERLFERFFQADEVKNIGKGTGIGLSLVKELVEIQEGKVEVESKLNEGSCFTVKLLLKEIMPVEKDEQKEEKQQSGVENPPSLLAEITPAVKSFAERGYLILVVEDNYDLRTFLVGHLCKNYRLIQAEDGLSGWNSCLKESPDLIISDVMMPGMDGVELCRRVKTDERTSHIPMLLLTAKSSEEAQLIGLQEGADDYIAKPFNLNLLEARIRNILKGRELLRLKFLNSIEIKPKEITVTSIDERFVKKVLDLVEENITDPNFSVETLSASIGMSRSNFYRKLHSITGKSPVEFIRIMKLKRACQLLTKTDLTVSEIAFHLGFNDLTHFRELFKKEFNCLPSEYGKNS